MFKKLICLTLMLFSGVTFANVIIPEVLEGHLDVKKNFSSKYVENRFLNIWLPPGYSNTRKYDVLYMHDGRMLFDAKTTWNKQEWQVDEVAAKLIQSGKVKPFIVVGIPNAVENRHSEYFPQKVFESLAKQKQANLYKLERYPGQKLFYSKVYSDNYARFVVEEVIPFIENNYSVNKGLNIGISQDQAWEGLFLGIHYFNILMSLPAQFVCLRIGQGFLLMTNKYLLLSSSIFLTILAN